MPECKKCNEHFPSSIKIDGKRKILNNRKFCLSCSPYKKHNTRKLNELKFQLTNTKICPRCNTEKTLDDFYLDKRRNAPVRYCKSCNSDICAKRARQIKIKCVEYKGGKCQECGYDKCIAALEFHHIDRSKKISNISKIKTSSWKNIKAELDKCVLLCNRCHREVEDGCLILGL